MANKELQDYEAFISRMLLSFRCFGRIGLKTKEFPSLTAHSTEADIQESVEVLMKRHMNTGISEIGAYIYRTTYDDLAHAYVEGLKERATMGL